MSPAFAWLPMLLALLALQVPAAAQADPPSPEEVLGYAIGDHFTDYAGVREYSRALAEASPLVTYQPYGMTPERRELFQLVIARPELKERLDAILAANEELTWPETSAARGREIARTNPAVVYFTYGLHGNESSSSEAALWTAWDLAREAPEVAGVLDSLVVVIDPVANPDGRDRYVQWFNSVVGARANPSLQAREHREPWPGGRFNHYLFDLNRDWAWGSQPETRARLATWWEWNPQVHVDFHEMSHNSTYFFFPPADPVNPIYPEFVLDWGRRFGEANARAFDARGWPYYTGEIFDLFYPGYGDSWPSLVGAVGMTYEQAGGGRAGRAVEQEAGDTLTLAERAEGHRTAGHATLRTAAAGRTAMLEDYAASQRAIGQGEPDVLLVPGEDAGRVEALVRHLREQGIEVHRAGSGFRASAQPYSGFTSRSAFPAGTYRVPARQARGRLATTLLQPVTELRAESSYDISAWALPYAYGVEAHQASRIPAGGDWQAVGAPVGIERAQPPAPETAFGYLVRPSEEAVAGVVRFLSRDGRARVVTRATTHGGRTFPAGSWFLPVRGNADLQRRVTEAGLGGLVTPVRTALSEEGVDLGSDHVRPVHLPRVAVLSGAGVSPTAFGSSWFYLEQELGIHFDALDLREFGTLDLGEYGVIVVPDAGGQALTEDVRSELHAWVERGGRLVAYEGAAALLAETFDVQTRRAEVGEEGDDPERFLLGREERERLAWTERVPGAIISARMDAAHPLAWGGGDTARDEIFVLHRGTLLFEPAAGVESAVYFPAPLQAVSGVISRDNLDRMEHGAWAVTRNVGRGSVVLFAGDPLFRMFWRTTRPLFVNALLLGPNP